MNEQKRGLRQRIYFYIQPADHKTNNFLRTALEDPVLRSPKEAVGAPISSTHNLYLVSWKDAECFMQIAYLSFNVFVRKNQETLPHFAMRKNVWSEKQKVIKEKISDVKLSLVKKTKPAKKLEVSPPIKEKRPKKCFPENPDLARKNEQRLATVEPTQKRTLVLLSLPKKKKRPKFVLVQKTIPKIKWATYVIIPQKDNSNGITMAYIRKSLLDCGLNTQSVYKSGKLNEENLDQVWEANGDTLFRLWRYARKNPLIHFSVFRTSKDGLFQNFTRVFSYPKDGLIQTESKILKFQQI